MDEPLAVHSGLSRVRAACDEAHACGARIAALGGFSSILGEMSSNDAGAAREPVLTTGNTLTAAVLASQVQLAGPRDLTVTVVGAGGDVGSGLCRILAAQGRRLVLVGRNPRPLEELRAELSQARTCGWDEAARTAELVVTVASTRLAAIAIAALAPGAIVLDAGHPSNAAPAAHIRYAQAGKVRHARTPQPDLPIVLADCAPGETHACLAEALVLAYEDRFEPYTQGRGGIYRCQRRRGDPHICGEARRRTRAAARRWLQISLDVKGTGMRNASTASTSAQARWGGTFSSAASNGPPNPIALPRS